MGRKSTNYKLTTTNYRGGKVSRSKLLILLATICIFLISPQITSAVEEPISLKISPLTFKFSIDKGESKTENVSLINPNDFEIKIQSEKEDFVMEDEEGTPKFLPQGADGTSLADWISVSLDKFTLAPQETKDISFEIKVPEDGEPGGHYAAIFFKTVPEEVKGQTQMRVSGRVGALVLVSVPGEVSQIGEIVEFNVPKFIDKGPINFLARFKNTGTVHYQLTGKVKIYNWFGKEVGQIDLPEHIVLPDSIRRFAGEWGVKYLFGKYRADLEMKDGEGNLQTTSLTFFAFPWKEGLIVLGSILILLAAVIITKKKFKIVKK